MQLDKPIVPNFYQVFDFEGGSDFIPNCINYTTADFLFKHHGFINDEVTEHYFKNYTQIPVMIEMLNVHHDIHEKISINKYEEYYSEDNIFIYAVEPFANLDHILGNEYSYNKLPFTHYMSQRALDLVRVPDNNFFLLVNFSTEGTIRNYTFEQFYNILKEANIPPKKFIFVSAASDISELHQNYANDNCIDINKRYKCISHTWSIGMKSEEGNHIIFKTPDKRQVNIDQTLSTLPDYSDINSEKIRNNKFINLNRRMRDHRVLLLSLLGPDFIKNNLVSYDWDYSNDSAEIEFFQRRVSSDLWELGLKNMLFIEKNMKKSWVDYEDVMSTVGFGCENKEPYLDSYINITSETNFFDAGVYFSEKTWKPILNLQPFISVNYHNSLEHLKKLGFKTFSPFIDESYDSTKDPAERMAKIYKEIKRLNEIPIKEIHDWYYSIIDDLKFNRELFLSFTGEKLIRMETDYIYSIIDYIKEHNKTII